MATGTKVVETWESQTDTSAVQAEAAVRVCQRNSLAPKSGKGGGKAAVHWDGQAINNHAITVVAAQPVTSGGKIVPLYRGLKFKFRQAGSKITKDRTQEGLDQWLAREHFGDSFDSVVNGLSNGQLSEASLRAFSVGIHFSLTTPTALVFFRSPDGERILDLYSNSDSSVESDGAYPVTASSRPASIYRTAIISADTLLMLAGLWADSRAHLGIDKFPSPSGTAPASVPSGNESAETLSRQGEGSALPTDRQSDRGANTPPRKARGLENPKGNARACGFAIPSSSDGQLLLHPPTMETHHGQAFRLPQHP